MRIPFATPAVVLALLALPVLAPADSGGSPADAPDASFQAGRFEDALAGWEQALRQAEQGGDVAGQARAQLGAGNAYLALGRPSLAAERLSRALALAREAGDAALVARATAGLGNALVLGGELRQGREALDQALRLAREGGDPAQAARAANDLAGIAAGEGDARKAASLYRESLSAARAAGDAALAARAAANLARALRDAGQARESAAALAEAGVLARSLPDSHARAATLVSIGRLHAAGAPAGRAGEAPRRQALAALEDAARTAQAIGDDRTLSYALGYQGALYQANGDPERALALSREAARAAQEAAAPESLYRWQWQTGRLLRQLGDPEGALTAYRLATATLDGIRPDLTVGRHARPTSFREQAGPVYLELTDLLLVQAAAARDPAALQAGLREARDTVERLKNAELEDYFQDDCVAALRSKTSGVESVAAKTAVLYPIVLPDRLAVLVGFPDGLRLYQSPVAARDLEAAVSALRRGLEKRTTREFLRPAQQVYDWLVRPVQADLAAAGIDTLVYVPDGVLRTVPLTVLHDGQEFLVSRYVVATSPGLTLTDPRPLAAREARILVGGLTDAVQGFPALPAVGAEIEALRARFPTTVLKNNAFREEPFASELERRPYSIVHVASHGEFGREVEDTFLLTYDGRITLNDLEAQLGGTAYRDQPVELLTLSACRTAAGDDRAALGLAGVAVKAGARSAVATLWYVSDQASSLLVSDFYARLQEGSVGKGQALRQAQLALMADRRYAHPAYWGPFLLIGNWL